ncbi:MAG: hypothetical protein A3K03_02785 [Bdellovibrionales bacterium RIFOXYD1_FULL_44_7]|nr:MAG: hypothetical protein A3K03_02785 [Bdellovibrionales bacterium RIFOXYD1_FULL_44_7]
MAKLLRIFSLGGNEVSPVNIKDPKTGKSVIPDIALQWQRTADTCRIIADIIERHPDDLFLITHGNGPQVGNILLRAEYSRPILHPLPLDICGADTQGAMGYMLSQLSSELRMRGIEKIVAETVTQVVVDANDPDFKEPTKFIGPQYTKDEALERQRKDGWRVKYYGKDKESKEIWRRVVPSPIPRYIVEIDAVEAHLKAGIIPISVGGGGIPVVEVEPKVQGDEEIYNTNYDIKYKRKHQPGRPAAKVYTGVEAVIDKDLASALLGISLLNRAKKRGEDLEVSLAIFTNEDGAKLNYQKPDQVDLRRLTLAEAKDLYEKGVFPAGSMGPKMLAVVKFIEGGGKVAYITKTPLYEKTVAGQAGTTVVRQ